MYLNVLRAANVVSELLRKGTPWDCGLLDFGKRSCACFISFWKGPGITPISRAAPLDCLCSMIGCINDAFLGR